MTPKITLYSFRRCPFAIRVRMVLHEKQLSFTTIEEDLNNFSPKLRELHPEARVPLIIHGDLVIYESAIITEYLDDCFPETKLMPDAAVDKMKVRQWTYWCNNIFKPDLDRFKYGTTLGLSQEEQAKAQVNLKGYLEKMNRQLSQSEWLVDNQYSLADIHVFPFYRQLSRIAGGHPDVDNYPAIKVWFEKIIARHAFERTMAKPSVA